MVEKTLEKLRYLIFDRCRVSNEGGGGDPHPFYLRPANEVTKRDLRHALTNMPSNAHPFCLTAKFLNLNKLIIDDMNAPLI